MPLLIALANFAPFLAKYLAGSDFSVSKITQVVSDVATSVTGAKTPQEAIEMLGQNAQLAQDFQLKILANSRDLDAMYLADIQDARARDVKLAQVGQRNIRADSMYILAVAVIILLVVLIWKTPDITEYVKGIVTLVLGRFLGYLDSIYNFEYGTTRSSKVQQDTINKLSTPTES